jgi:TonB family protein
VTPLVFLAIVLLQEQPQSAPLSAAPETAETVAEAPRVVVRREPLVSFSERGDAAGHTGRATVEATLGTDGKFTDAVVVESARSEFLDSDALQTVLDAGVGRNPAEAVRARMSVEFRPTDALTMKCSEFTQQVRWYEAAWPERTFKDTIIYVMTLGYEFLLTRQAGASINDSLSLARTFEPAFERTLAECERYPNRGYIDVLHRQMR